MNAQLLAKARAARTVLIVGDEHLLRARALASIAGEFEDDFDSETFSAESRDPQEWIGSAGTAPFLAERRVVIVRSLLRVEPATSIAESLKALPASALLILVADEETGDDTRQARLKTAAKVWQRLVESAGGVVVVCEAGKDIRSDVRAEAAARGKKISGAAVERLSLMTGGSLSRALDEVEKLSLFVGEREEIRDEDVQAAVAPSPEWDAFKLTDAVIQGNAPEALKQLRVLVGSASRAEEAAYRSIFPNVLRQLRLTWQARLLLDAGATPDAPGAAARLLPGKPNLLSEPTWRQNAAMRAARRVDLGRLAACIQALADADARLKGLLPGYSPMETLEEAMLRIAELIAA